MKNFIRGKFNNKIQFKSTICWYLSFNSESYHLEIVSNHYSISNNLSKIHCSISSYINHIAIKLCLKDIGLMISKSKK